MKNDLTTFSSNQLLTLSALLSEVTKTTDSAVSEYGYNSNSGNVWVLIEDYDIVLYAFEGRGIDCAYAVINTADDVTEYDSLQEAINAI